jgi:hypothetical protein
MNEPPWLSRQHMLAAEVFGYSYANYEDHLGIGNVRFEELMPDDVDILERAEREGWEVSHLAKALELPEDRVPGFQRAYREAKEIVDAPSLAQFFRRGVLVSIRQAIEEGLGETESIERLATQICYRAADLAFRLDMEGRLLSEYSEELRKETEYDEAYTERLIQQDIEERLSQAHQEEDDSGV